MVELEDHVPDELLFGDDYGFLSGGSPALVRHFATYAAWARSTFHFPAAVIEIACNDGTLLHHFNDGHTRVVGVDPAGPATDVARERGLDVVTAPFTAELAAELDADLPTNRLVIANNVIAHVLDLDDFVTGLARLVGNHGAAVLEFQYLPDLLLGTQFDLVYHEHRRFLSLTSLLPIVRHHGLDVVRTEHIDTQGGSLRVILRRYDVQTADLPASWWLESWIRDVGAYTELQGRVDYVCDRLRQLINHELEHDRLLALYGAPAKATTLLHCASLTQQVFHYAVDLTPRKIGRFMPGTDIPIISPSQEQEGLQADTYLLAVGNYASSVLRRERAFVDGGGRFILPTPRPVIL